MVINTATPTQIAVEHSRLLELVRPLGRVVVAFSGGVDSTLVLKIALEALGEGNVLAATGVSASLAGRELEAVKDISALLGASLELIQTDEVQNPAYAANPTNRCYYCKNELYGRLSAVARAGGYAHILNGANLDDTGDHRPGMSAAREWNVRSPLLEAGMTKPRVRALASALGLPNWDKPALACLSSRIAYGTPVTLGALAQIERAEAFLYEHGFKGFRVRHHQKLARIEILPADFPRLLAEPLRSNLIVQFKQLGYTYITVDLQGFRSGSGNEAIAKP